MRVLISSSSGLIAALTCAMEKKRRLRRRAMIPALRHQHRRLHLGLVSRLARPGGQHGDIVMLGHGGHGAVEPRLVAVGRHDHRARVVRHHHARHAAQEGEQVHLCADPVLQRLGRPGLGIGVARCAHRRDKQTGLAHLAGQRIDDLDPVAGEVDEHLVAAEMGLAHGRADPALPGLVVLAEPGVAVALRVGRAVLLPEQRARHALAAQLAVDGTPVRHRSLRHARADLTGEEQQLQRVVVI